MSGAGAALTGEPSRRRRDRIVLGAAVALGLAGALAVAALLCFLGEAALAALLAIHGCPVS